MIALKELFKLWSIAIIFKKRWMYVQNFTAVLPTLNILLKTQMSISLLWKKGQMITVIIRICLLAIMDFCT